MLVDGRTLAPGGIFTLDKFAVVFSGCGRIPALEVGESREKPTEHGCILVK